MFLDGQNRFERTRLLEFRVGRNATLALCLLGLWRRLGLVSVREILLDGFIKLAIGNQLAAIQPKRAAAVVFELVQVVGRVDEGSILIENLGELLNEFLVVDRIGNPQAVVNEVDVRVHEQRHRKRKAIERLAGVATHLLIGQSAKFGELYDLGEALLQTCERQAEEPGDHSQVIAAAVLPADWSRQRPERNDAPRALDGAL